MTSRRRATSRLHRGGWSLIEVIIAIGILGGTLAGLGEFGRRFSHANGNTTLSSQATDLAVSRVERVKFERNYTTIDTCATGVQTAPAPFTNFKIQTQVARTNTAVTDYKVVTVTVTHPKLATAVTKTTAIASF